MSKSKSAKKEGLTKRHKIVAAIVAAIFLVGLIGTCVSSEGFTLGADDMPVGEIIEARDQFTKKYYLGNDKYAVDVSLHSVHYEDVYGDWQEIDTTVVPSARPNWNYEVVKGNWHLLISNDTSVAIGKDGNWIGFKYAGFGYLDWSTKDYHILQTTQSVTPVIEQNKITWPDIFYGADLEYIYTPDGFKENLYITQTARDWLTANPPSSFGLDNASTYLVGMLECDWRLSLPAIDILGFPINWDTVNEFIDSGVFWTDPVTDKIVSALPIGYATHAEISPEDYVDLRYRFYKDNDTHYLLFGAGILDLNSLPVGTIILDPSIDEQVSATADDAMENEGTGIVFVVGTQIYHRANTDASSRFWGAHRWVSGTLPEQGDVIDVAYMELYCASTSGDDINGNWHFEKAESPLAFSSTAFDITDRTRTTASVSWIANSLGTGVKQSPSLVTPLQEVINNYSPDSLVAIFRPNTNLNKNFDTYSWNENPFYGAKLHIEYHTPVYAPEIVTYAATNVEDTTATLNGEVTDTGGDDPTVTVYWGDEDGGEVPEAWDNNSVPTSPAQPQGAATFYKDATSLPTGTTIYFTARAVNSGGTDWGSTQSFLTKPAAPTDVDATDDLSDKVTLTWTKSTGATGYYIYRDGELLDTVGDVATYDDEAAAAPQITAGSTVASDGTSTAHVALSLSGTSVADGTEYDYKLKAFNAAGDSDDSETDNGHRKAGALEYQWQRSDADSDADYSNITGATSATYEDTEAPAGTITAGSTVASDGSSTSHVALSLSGTSVSDGDGRYFQCVQNAAGAEQKISDSDRGYRTTGALEYQWQRSANDSDADYSNITGATMAAHNDTAAPAPTITAGNATATDGTSDEYVTLDLENEAGNNGAGRYFQCVQNAAGADSQTSISDRGYRTASALYYQWYRSISDAAGNYSAIPDATSVPYNDTGGVYEPDGRYYLCAINMTGAVSQNSTADRGYMFVPVPPVVTGLAAIEITGNSAKLRVEVTDTGGVTVTTVGFEWGETSGNYTYSWNTTGDYGLGLFTHIIRGLTINTQYYWRAYATNKAGTNYSAELDFWTLALPLAPADFKISQVGSGAIEITFTMGIAANTTFIVASESGYPESIEDGYIVYSGNGTSVVLSGLTFDTTKYYYRAWSHNQYGYSLDYAEASIGNPISVASILFVIALCGFALWKKSWLRLLLAICILIWAAFTAQYDIKIAAPLLVIGTILFVSDIFKLWRSHKERQPSAEIITRESQGKVIY